MSKKVVVISASLRSNSNSDALAAPRFPVRTTECLKPIEYAKLQAVIVLDAYQPYCSDI